jgi:rhamnosyltransferase subunit B
MDLILIPLGSSGDVHPFVGLGRSLAARGHRVTVISNGHFEKLIRGAGLNYEGLGDGSEFLSAIADPDIWHPTRGFAKVMSFVQEIMPRLYDRIIKLHTPGKTAFIASTLAFPARLAQEKLNVPVITVHLQPTCFRSVYEAPILPGTYMPHGSPRWFKAMQWWLADQFIDHVIGRPVNQMRRSLNLPPVRGIMRDWFHSPLLTLGLFPEWFSAPQPDWPRQIKLTGFPLYDERDVTANPPALETFLNAGEPPIVFTPGSAMLHGRPFFQAAADACVRMNRRGVLLSRFPENIPPNLPPSVLHVDFAPFSTLLPRAGAMVHHGGIGTLSQAFAAGVPQLIMPMAHDQFDNAARAIKLGVAEKLHVRQFKGPAVAAKLTTLLRSDTTAAHAKSVADRLRHDDALGRSCDLIEQSLQQASVRE